MRALGSKCGLQQECSSPVLMKEVSLGPGGEGLCWTLPGQEHRQHGPQLMSYPAASRAAREAPSQVQAVTSPFALPWGHQVPAAQGHREGDQQAVPAMPTA